MLGVTIQLPICDLKLTARWRIGSILPILIHHEDRPDRRDELANSALILDSAVFVPGIVHEARCMHVSAALPYAGGLPPSIFKRSVILKNTISS